MVRIDRARAVLVVAAIALVVAGFVLIDGPRDTLSARVASVGSAVLVWLGGGLAISTCFALPRLRSARILRRRLPDAAVFVAANQYDVLRELAKLSTVDSSADEALGDFVTVSIDEDGLTVWSTGVETRAVTRIEAADIHSVEPGYVNARLGRAETLHVRAWIAGDLTSLTSIPTVEIPGGALPSSFRRASELTVIAQSRWGLDGRSPVV